MSSEKIGVIGLGYVGLPLALALAAKYPGTVGFDVSAAKIAKISAGQDPTDEGLSAAIKGSSLKVSDDPTILEGVTFFIVGVPTPVDENHNPDLQPLLSACDTIGNVLRGGEVVVFESTVYPGVTEDICGPRLAKVSGLTQGKDFKLGYSPERINPGDKEHTLERVIKVVSGEDSATLERVAGIYSKVITVGVHRASSIKVAEAAKVIENTQRDLNIALMNELAVIFDKIGISTGEVLQAAGTKWNFLRFSPGLVGGHCIGVDPYYLTTKAEQLGYHPQVILAGRRINDAMGRYIAERTVKLMVNSGIQPKGARVGVLGLTFKENVTDIRNSRVPDIINELHEFGVETVVYDPHVRSDEALHEYNVTMGGLDDFKNLDGVIIAVAHKQFVEMGAKKISGMLRTSGILIDVKGVLPRVDVPAKLTYWSL